MFADSRFVPRRLSLIALSAMLVWMAPLLWSCGENTETIIYETETVTEYDTLYDTLTETLYRTDTVYADTLYDTLMLPEGRASNLLFGVVYDVSTVLGDSVTTVDSVYAGITSFANPARSDMRCSVNGDELLLEDGQQEYVIVSTLIDMSMGYIFPGVNMLALLDGALYEGFVPRGSEYAMQVVVPVYNFDSAGAVTFDTIEATATVPPPADSVEARVGATVYERVWDPDAGLEYHVIPGDSAVRISWSSVADFYVVSVYRYWFDQFYGPMLTGEPIDSMLMDTSLKIPAGYLAFDTTMDVEDMYDVAVVEIAGVNGPAPSSWDTLPSFDSRGLLLGLNAEYAATYLVPDNGYIVMGKRRTVAAAAPKLRTRTTPEMVVSALRDRGLSNDD